MHFSHHHKDRTVLVRLLEKEIELLS